MPKTSQEDRLAIEGLAARARKHDGYAPLNEEAILAFDAEDTGTPTGPKHFLIRTDTSELVGYLQYNPKFHTAQLVVDPVYRRKGLGSHLYAGINSQVAQPPDLWAFGNLPAAQAFAAHHELQRKRSLLIMERDLPSKSVPVPSGLKIRAFQPGDASAFLALNRAAFSHHLEQGQLDEAGLSARMAEEWFDANGLLLGFDDEGLAAFHWTKKQSAKTGEVYVIAVAPRAQGRGYGKALLAAGLEYLTAQGCKRVILYVDGEELGPVIMYKHAGFSISNKDILYARRSL